MSSRTKRRERRKQALYQINCAVEESNLEETSDDLVSELVQAIHDNNLSKFGVVKLSKVNLNVALRAHGTTLLGLAAREGRDSIVYALIMGGADPSFSYDGFQCKGAREGLLKKYPSPYICFIARLLEAGRKGLREETTVCSCCEIERARLSLLCSSSHSVCDGCFWRMVGTRSPDEEILCPVLDCRHYFEGGGKESGGGEIRHTGVHVQDCRSFKKRQQLESLARFSLLPLDAPPGGSHTKKPRFTALPLRRALEQFIGTYQAQRSLELIKAAKSGNSLRLEAIIRAGANVNYKNEYGQSALFMSAWMGHVRCVRVLLQYCPSDDADNAGVTALMVAERRGNVTIANLLKAEGYTSGEDTFIFAPPLEHFQHTTVPSVMELISPLSDHPGAGSYVFDNCFPEDFLTKLLDLHAYLPVAAAEKESCSDRSYMCDSLGWIQEAFHAAKRAIDSLGDFNDVLFPQGFTIFSNMRFLHYTYYGGYLAPHTDLSRTDDAGISSTKTFILYVCDSHSGGETNLLERVQSPVRVLASVTPKRGRLLVFPHVCPHEGALVVDVPKLLLRGEMY
jgi:ankyrin repeat protein